MKRIEVTGSLDEVVEELIRIREQGEHAYAKFERVTLSSDTVDLEQAYKDVYGMTRDAFLERHIRLIVNHYYNWTKSLVIPELLSAWYNYLKNNCQKEDFENHVVGAKLIMDAYKERGTSRRNFTAIVKKRCHKNKNELNYIKWIIGYFFKDSEELYDILNDIYDNFDYITRLSYANELEDQKMVDNYRFVKGL